MVSDEQKARDMLERMGIEEAQSFTAGDVVELANLIGKRNPAATRKYDSTVARIAGNLLSGRGLPGDDEDTARNHMARIAVAMARAIIAEMKRTESEPESK